MPTQKEIDLVAQELKKDMTGIARELTYDERASYGECPVCGAQHGEWCKDDQQGPHHGVHLGRLQNAPFKIREVPVRG